MKARLTASLLLFLLKGPSFSADISYRGISPGRSTAKDVRRILGAPNRIDVLFPVEGIEEFVYVNPEPGTEETRVGLRRQRVTDITITPVFLSVRDAIARYGNGFQRVRYSFDSCKSDGESAPLYENHGGSIEYIEYRDRGLYLLLALAPERVQFINYQLTPPGAPKSVCLGKSTGSKK
jgi:hypothetical protein